MKKTTMKNMNTYIPTKTKINPLQSLWETERPRLIVGEPKLPTVPFKGANSKDFFSNLPPLPTVLRQQTIRACIC